VTDTDGEYEPCHRTVGLRAIDVLSGPAMRRKPGSRHRFIVADRMDTFADEERQKANRALYKATQDGP